jgi:hypothetical protein
MTHELRALARAGASGTTQAELGPIGTVMAQDDSLSGFWHRFEETLLRSPTSDDVFSTRAVEEAFSKNELIERSVHASFFSAVPGILTGLGLLMTFVAILDGLSHVSVDANMDVAGIGGLINGLSGKFVSSVTAVTCAVAFVFVERFAYSRPNEAYRALVRELSSRFRRKTAEQMLHEIQIELAAARAADRAVPRLRS